MAGGPSRRMVSVTKPLLGSILALPAAADKAGESGLDVGGASGPAV
jgi:hypothetical protein